jgi:ABC-type branched-subunit amino acid transport system permease subunit
MVLLTALAQFLEVFYQLLNDHIDWWYVLVGVFLNVPIIIAFAFVITFFNKDEPSSRVLLRTAVILSIVTLTLSAIWNAVYFWFFYKHEEVVTGNDGIGFTHATRKQEIVFSSYIALVLDCFFAYFLCVIANYIHAYDNSEIEAKVKAFKDEEAAKKAAADEEKGEKDKVAGSGDGEGDGLVVEENKDEEENKAEGEDPPKDAPPAGEGEEGAPE